MKSKAEKYARDTAYKMFQAGFAYVEAQRMRPYLEAAYMAGAKARKIITEDVIMQKRCTL